MIDLFVTKMPLSPRHSLLRRLLAATLLPALLGFAAFGFFTESVATRAFEEELGRRLSATALAAALQILPEQIDAIGAGDEDSRTFANLSKRVHTVQRRFDVRRVVLIARDLTGRADSAGRVALGAQAHEFTLDRDEIASAARGKPVSSPLFFGKDGLPYKRAYAPVVDGDGAAAGFVVVEGNADFYSPLSRFRRWLIGWGAVTLCLIGLALWWVARRITGPVARLASAAHRIGAGDLTHPVAVETRDEIGQLAARLDEMRGALRARDERLQMMLAGIAHEVRNPLGGLELFSGLLHESLSDDPERLHEVTRIQKEVKHLNAVVEDFLAYARRGTPEKVAFDLAKETRETVDAVAATPGASVILQAPDSLVVSVDPDQIKRVLLNLIRNARAAAGPIGHVRVALSIPGQADSKNQPGPPVFQALIDVQDDGPGVAAELRSKIFDPFFTTREKGTGLGLAFVHEIVQSHGGRIEVATSPLGGASFRVLL